MGRWAALALAPAVAALASDWLTFSSDPQRTGWAKAEIQLSRQNVVKLRIKWKRHLDAAPKQMTGLTVPLVVRNILSGGQKRDILVVAGASDDLFALDANTGAQIWKRHFTTEDAPQRPDSWTCPNALNATPAIDKKTGIVYALSSDGKLYSLSAANAEDRRPPRQFVPPFSKNWSLNLAGGVLYTTISQNCNSAASGVYSVNGDSPDGPPRFFQAAPHGAGIWGRAGATLDLSGHILASTGDGVFDPTSGKFSNSLLVLDAKTLEIADYYTPSNYAWLDHKDLDLGNTSPVVFELQSREIIAAAGKEGVIYVLDAKSPGGLDHHTPLFRSAQYLNREAHLQEHGFWGALSTWVDQREDRWLFAPAWGPPVPSTKFPLSHGPVPQGSVMAFRVSMTEGRPELSPAWISGNLASPEPVIVANGLVFALANGANEKLDREEGGEMLTGEERAATPAGNAILSVLDSETGRELYSSGKLIEGWTHFGGLALSDGCVYLSTHDGTVYAFAAP